MAKEHFLMQEHSIHKKTIKTQSKSKHTIIGYRSLKKIAYI